MTPEYHNPQKIESPGEGFRFCLVSENLNVPDDAEFWNVASAKWEPATGGFKHHLNSFLTYRTRQPLPAEYQEEEPPPVITLRADDWRDLCSVMRDLTWGQDCSSRWHSLRERVSRRNAAALNQPQEEEE